MTHRFTDPLILKSVAAVADAEAALTIVLANVQENCQHTFIGTTYHRGDMRLCLTCGKEEHAPSYHTFLFSLKDGLMVPMGFDDFIASRVPGAGVINLRSKAR